MSDEEIESFFTHVNYVEDTINECEEESLYHYVLNHIMSNEYCDIDDYKEYVKEKWKGGTK